MGKRPPCVLYQSFLVLSVFVHDAPNKGAHPPVMHLTSLESHHSRDSPRGALIGCDGSRHFFVPLQRSACDWTQVSLLLLLFMAFGADAPHRPTQKVVWLIGSRRRQKEGKGCAVLFGFQRTGGGYRESPLTFHAEKLRGLCAKILNFHKFFYFHKDSADFPADV